MLITNSAPPTREELDALNCYSEIQHIINLGASGSTDQEAFEKKYAIVASSIILEWVVKFLSSLPDVNSDVNSSYRSFVNDIDCAYSALMEGRSDNIEDLRGHYTEVLLSWRDNTSVGYEHRKTLTLLGKYILDCLPGRQFTVRSIHGAFNTVASIVDTGIKSSISLDDMEKLEGVIETACRAYTRQFSESVLSAMENSSIGFTRPDPERDFEIEEVHLSQDTLTESLNAVVMSPLIEKIVIMCKDDVCERLCSMFWDEWNPQYRLIPFTTPGFQ